DREWLVREEGPSRHHDEVTCRIIRCKGQRRRGPADIDVSVLNQRDRTGYRNREAHSVARRATHRHDDVAGRGSAWYWHDDAASAPTRWRGHRSIERDRARSLGRTEVRACDGHGCADGSARRRQ